MFEGSRKREKNAKSVRESRGNKEALDGSGTGEKMGGKKSYQTDEHGKGTNGPGGAGSWQGEKLPRKRGDALLRILPQGNP